MSQHVHVRERYGTPIGSTPGPSVWLAAKAAQAQAGALVWQSSPHLIMVTTTKNPSYCSFKQT